LYDFKLKLLMSLLYEDVPQFENKLAAFEEYDLIIGEFEVKYLGILNEFAQFAL